MWVDILFVLLVTWFLVVGGAFCALHTIYDRLVDDARRRFPGLVETLDLPKGGRWAIWSEGLRGFHRVDLERRFAPINYLLRFERVIKEEVPFGDPIRKRFWILKVGYYSTLGFAALCGLAIMVLLR